MPRTPRTTSVLRVTLVVAAGALVWWALDAARWRAADGSLVASVVVPLALSCALVCVGVSLGTAWGAAGRWFALLLAGQGAALALVDAPNRVAYQHYALGSAYDVGPLVVPGAMVLLQALLVLVALRGRWTGVLAWWRSALGAWGRAFVLATLVLTSATLSRNVGIYAVELVVATLVQLTGVGTLLLLAQAVPLDADTWVTRRLLGGDARHERPRAIEPFSLALALWVTVAAAVLAVWSYERHPHVPDEVVYLLHARYLAAGHLTLPLPPVADAFNIDLMYYDVGRWFSPVPPGWPAVLAVGAWLGAPWLVNPVLGGMNLLLVNGLLAELYPARTRRLAVLLLAASPWFLFMSMNYMTHQATMACAIGAALAVARARRVVAHRHRWMLVGGVLLGGVSLIRPLEGLAAALVLGVVSLFIRAGRLRFTPSAALVAGAVATGALVRPYNAYLTGSASYFPIMAYVDKYYVKGSNDLGFGANRGLGWPGLDPFPGHGPLDVVVNANQNLFQINTELFGWMAGSLGLVAFALARRRLQRTDLVMVGAITVVAGIHSFYWFSGGPDFGARYWYLVLVPCVVLAVRGAEELGASVTRGRPSARREVQLAVAAAALAAVLVFVPWRAVGKYHHYRGMRPDIRELAASRHFGRSVVFVRGKRHPDYVSAAIYNPLDLRADSTVYAWDVSPDVRRQVVAAYPGRPVWLVDGPSITGTRFRVRAGPLGASQAVREP